MASEVVVVHANEAPPKSWDAAVFLAGPLPRSAEVPSWNPEAIAHLREGWCEDGRLVVFTPEPRAGVTVDYTGQIEWEHRGLHDADAIVFWVPRDLETMPAFTTNIEFGSWYDSGKVVFGAPVSAPKNEYLVHLAESRGVPVADTLEGTVQAALEMIGAGSRREGGERSVPLLVWRTGGFQSWYGAQRAAGNRLLGARLEWTFRVEDGRGPVCYWAAHVQMHVAAEDRVKANEVVIGRPDTAHVLLHRPGTAPDEALVVLAREFRSAAATPDGRVHELPGGSGDEPEPVLQAAAEVREETGLGIAAERLRPYGVRQASAAGSAHRAHLFAAEITDAELAWLRERQGTPGGAGGDERTWIEIVPYREVREQRLVDWATLGMIAQVLGS